MELVPIRKQAMIGGIYSTLDTIPYFVAVIYFWGISKYWYYLAAIGYCMEILTAILIWFLPESPRALVDLNRIEEAEIALRKIAWWTNKQS